MAIDSKRIAKNTLFLYARLLLVYGISLYSSRVILDKLGVTDYGLHGVVYGVIGMLSFLNATLSSGTSRFITFDLGKGELERLKRTFSTALYTHILLAGIVFVIAETLGLWYVHHVLVCPPERFYAVLVIYQISIVQSVLGIIQVPFVAEVMAHERMGIYAYLGIYESLFRLLLCYVLVITPGDRLITLSLMTLGLTVSVFFFYFLYSKKNFKEVSFKKSFDRNSFKSILAFSGWNIVANMSNTLMKQGVIMLFNLFFAPVVVAAQNISNNLSNALMQFVDGVRQAINPQVIKSYADGRYADSKHLTLESAEYVFDLLLLMGIPMILCMPKFMSIWLVDVPEYAVIFTQLIILQDILANFNAAFYTPMVAANKIQKNTYASVILCVTQFGTMYVLFKLGCGPVWARLLGIIFIMIWSFVVKPYILWKDLDYNWGEMIRCILRCLRTFAFAGGLCLGVTWLIPQNSFFSMILVAGISMMVVATISLLFMEKSSRIKLINLLLRKFHLRKS